MNTLLRIPLSEWPASRLSHLAEGLAAWLRPALEQPGFADDFLLVPADAVSTPIDSKGLAPPVALVQRSIRPLAMLSWSESAVENACDEQFVREVICELHAVGQSPSIGTLLPVNSRVATELADAGWIRISDVVRYAGLSACGPSELDPRLGVRGPRSVTEVSRLIDRIAVGSRDFPELPPSAVDATFTALDDVRIGTIDNDDCGVCWIERTGVDEGGLRWLGIVPEWRGRGLGKMLLRTSLGKAEAAGIERVTIDVDARNSYAIGIYESCGFCEAGRRELWCWIEGGKLPTSSAQADCEE